MLLLSQQPAFFANALQSCQQEWYFEPLLIEQDTSFFEEAVCRHGIITLEYSAFCSKLIHEYRQLSQDEQIQRLQYALMQAEFLAYLYRHYLVVPREVERLQNEAVAYRSLLQELGYNINLITYPEITPDFFTQLIRSFTASTNPPRLFLLRVRRLIDWCFHVNRDIGSYNQFIVRFDAISKPIFQYLGWMFFIPRLVINLFLLFKHLTPGVWMDEKEKSMSWNSRLHAQLQRRWFELANDSVWLLAGVLTCFVLIGSLAPAGACLTVSLYFYDVFTAGLRAATELNRYHDLLQEYNDRLASASQTEREEILSYKAYLEKRIYFEQKKLFLSVINTSLLALLMCTTLPIIAANPAIALAGAALLVIVTAVIYGLSKWHETTKPNDKTVAFFATLPKPPPTPPTHDSAQNLLDVTEVTATLDDIIANVPNY